MNRKYIKALSVLAIALIILPLIPSAIHVARAQTIATIVDWKKAVTPGGILWVKINVPVAGMTVNISVTNIPVTGSTQVWVTMTRTFLTAGTYNITLRLPKLLKNLVPNLTGGPAYGRVLVKTLGVTTTTTSPPYRDFIIKPLIVVKPSVTTDINISASTIKSAAVPSKITVYGYGFPPGDSFTNVEVTSATLSKSWSLTSAYTSNSSGVVVIPNLDFKTIGWLPRGTYQVYVLPFNTSIESPGSLTISPAVIITPTSGNGEYTQKITIRGFGFDANAEITNITLKNTNFTNVEYVFTGNATNSTTVHTLTTNSSGCFVAYINSKSYPHLVPVTNMSAGLYIVTVNWSAVEHYPKQTQTTPLIYNSKKKLYFAQDKVVSDDVIVNSSLVLNASQTYVPVVKKSVSSYRVVAEFTYQGTPYYLIADITYYNLTTSPPIANVTFYLYNAASTPLKLLGSKTVVNATYLTTTSPNYFYAWVAFNVTPTSASLKAGTIGTPIPSNYTFKAKYWGNVTLSVGNLYVYMKKWILYAHGSNLTIFYNNTATGTVKKFFFSGVAGNLTMSNTTDEVQASISLTDKSYSVSISYIASLNITNNFNTSTLELEVSQTLSHMQGVFRSVAYVVRPLLVQISPSVIKPGEKVKFAAYGYAPGKVGAIVNKLHLLWDEKIPLKVYNATTSFSNNTVVLGKDGNVTFTVEIPKTVTYGAHYLRGKDSFGYEYSIMVLIGAKAYFKKVSGITSSLEVTAGYPVGKTWKRLVVTTCATLTSCTFCKKKITTKFTDYLGDNITVKVSGLTPGTKVDVYFGNVLVKEVVVKGSTLNVSFIVPPVPEGTYPIKVVTSSGVLVVNNFMLPNGSIVTGELHVVPKVLIVSMSNMSQVPVLVGPGFVRVIGTGFPPGVTVKSIYVNDTAVLYSVNSEIANWYTDAQGVLKAYGNLYPGLYIPAMQPGLYKIGLVFNTPSGTEISQPGYVFIVNNLTSVATGKALKSVESNIMSQISSTKNEVMSSISSVSSSVSSLGNSISSLGNQISSLKTSISSLSSQLSGQLSSMSSTLSTIKSDMSTLLSKTSSIASSVSSLSSGLSSISSTLNTVASSINDVKSGISDLKSYVSSLKSSLSSVLGDTATIKSGIDTLKSMVSNIKLSVDLTPITSKLSSISSQLSSIKSTLGQLSTISSTLSTVNTNVQKAVSAANSAASAANAAKTAAQSAASAVNNVKTVLGSKIDSATYVLYVATIFAVLAFIFAILSWATARRVAR